MTAEGGGGGIAVLRHPPNIKFVPSGIERGLRYLESSTLIETINLSGRCNLGCRHCAQDFKRDGPEMEFSKVKKMLSFRDLRFKDCIELAGGEPMNYLNDEYNIASVVGLLAKKELTVTICTNGISKGQAVAQEAIEDLRGYAKGTSFVLSFHLFRGKPEGAVAKAINSVNLMNKCGIPISGIVVTYCEKNENDTKKLYDSVVKETGLSVDYLATGSSGKLEYRLITSFGRGANLTEGRGISDKSIRNCRTMKDYVKLSIGPEGGVTTCCLLIAPPTPVANVFEHTWSGIIKSVSEYQNALYAHHQNKPED
ncbi:MAG: radical SAM protein, partial [Candidatus Micrarchaeota archaeon]